ncbi:MAG: response regulator, partial [Thermoanaerobaculia bacterium]|nr:response regulator [Thermoanaerobaculia bacterium]
HALGRESSLRRAAPAASAAAERVAARLLLVDDSRVTREMERRILEDAGFHVEVAGDGDEAMRRLAGESFDCLVTDIEMPGLDGFALTAELRRIERFARLPIVVVSTRERPEDRLRGLRAGADAYLTKQSLIAADLVDTVRRLTGGGA